MNDTVTTRKHPIRHALGFMLNNWRNEFSGLRLMTEDREALLCADSPAYAKWFAKKGARTNA